MQRSRGRPQQGFLPPSDTQTSRVRAPGGLGQAYNDQWHLPCPGCSRGQNLGEPDWAHPSGCPNDRDSDGPKQPRKSTRVLSPKVTIKNHSTAQRGHSHEHHPVQGQTHSQPCAGTRSGAWGPRAGEAADSSCRVSLTLAAGFQVADLKEKLLFKVNCMGNRTPRRQTGKTGCGANPGLL